MENYYLILSVHYKESNEHMFIGSVMGNSYYNPVMHRKCILLWDAIIV